MMEYNKRSISRDPVIWILVLAALTLLVFSIRFATERIVFTDTAVYLYTMADTGHSYIATNRFICLLSQVLPLAGIAMGLSLKTVIYLYSINCILIPIVSSFICFRVFRNKEAALAILLFYVLMSARVFYYPVTEFQMGLCLLLVYHAFVLWYCKKGKGKPWLFGLVSLPMVVTIIFAHPLVLYVYFAWSVWLFLNYPESRKRLLIFPPVVALAAHFFKEYFFKAMVGASNYDEQRKEGLANFKAPVGTYLDSVLGKGVLQALTGDYFIMLLLVVLLLLFYAGRKQWLNLLFFAGVVTGFWLLVTVSFRDWPYDHYPEHLYQPVPFFISLAFATVVPGLFRHTLLRAISLLVIFVVSFGKIYNNHRFYTGRLDWYRQYIDLMRRSGIRNATLAESHKIYGVQYSYWASNCESLLLSGIPGPDSAVRIVVEGDAAKLNTNRQPAASTRYFGDISGPFVSLDSLYGTRILDSLASASQKH